MANELTRVSDRLTRARQQAWNGATRAWLPPPARREPTPRELIEQHRDAGDEAKRPPAALVAIHVEVRHHTEPTRTVIDAQPVEYEESERYEAYAVDEPPTPVIAQLPPPVAAASEPFLLPAAAGDSKSANKQSRGSGIFHYFTVRALRAYLTQRTFASGAAPEPRMIDLRA